MNPMPIEVLQQNALIDEALQYSMTCRDRMNFLAWAIDEVSKIDGVLVECGVWKGGNLLLMKKLSHKPVWGYDTFSGMPKPGKHDKYHGKKPNWREGWNQAELDQVGNLVHGAILVVGKVQDTIPEHAPEKIALLRLDTDFYESTKHELEHLYPRLQKGGIFITDDFGSWSGAKKACIEYFGEDHGLKQIGNTNAYWKRK